MLALWAKRWSKPKIKKLFEAGWKELYTAEDEGAYRLIHSLENATRHEKPQPDFTTLFNARNLHKMDPRLMAYLIPAILDRMNDKDLQNASYAIAKQLAAKDFRMLADKNYFEPKIHIDSASKIKIRNANERALQIFGDPAIDKKIRLNFAVKLINSSIFTFTSKVMVKKESMKFMKTMKNIIK